MSTRFVIEGLDELRAELRNLPADLTAEAGHLVEAATNAAEADVRAGYAGHRVTGDLLDHVSSDVQTDQFAVVGTVKSASKLAYIFEEGSAARHYITVHGVTHLTGSMPAAHVFIPALQRNRRRMYDTLRDLLQRHGLEVSGDA